ncbi:MAG TPA: TIGR03668 family PPOX class F420-dependent oxidoreductase [Ktedonobacteraceae bacterium]|jgi:PPOX class probable F420-dependent enzyme
MLENRITLSENEIRFIERQRVARLATADADGHPTLVPVCYAFDSTHFYTPLDEKPKSIEASKLKRVRNIEARHEASLLIDQYADDWSHLGYILVHARADLLLPDHSLHATALLLLRARYIQYQQMALEHLPVIVLTPERVRSWGPALEHA